MVGSEGQEWPKKIGDNLWTFTRQLFLSTWYKLMKSNTLRSVHDVTEGSTQEEHMCASCVLPRKVGKMVWIFNEVSFEENDVCFLCASYYVPLILTYGYMKKIMCASCVLPTMYH